jgi:hypothetical protein
MKHVTTILLVFLTLAATRINAQTQYEKHFDITAYGAYMWGDYYPAYNAEVKVNAAGYWGIALGMSMGKKFAGEFHYQMVNTSVSIRPYLGNDISPDNVDVTSNWFLIGSMNELPMSKKFSLFGYGGIGAVYNVPTSSEKQSLNLYQSTWSFGVAIQGGFKYWVSDRIALRGFLALNMPMQFSGVGFYLGTGGSGLGLNSYSSLFLFNMGGGITFRLK